MKGEKPIVFTFRAILSQSELLDQFRIIRDRVWLCGVATVRCVQIDSVIQMFNYTIYLDTEMGT